MRTPVTYLFVPADRPERFAKAMGSGADRVILDLEDAVRPEAKPAARAAIRAAALDWPRVVVRVNPATTEFIADDLSAVAATGAMAVMLPKAEEPREVARVRDAIGREIEVIPQIETALGLERVDALLGAQGVRRVAFGHLDYALDLGCVPEWEALTLARQRLVWRSRLAGRDAPVDSVTPELDPARVAEDTARAKALGMGGKLLIHPAQVAPSAESFAPTEAELAWARRVLAAVAAGAGAIAVDGRMVDKPVEDAARRILDLSPNAQEHV
ncbi:citrate lyase subunit beta / citryl-CoA lyase [Ruegeria marina]|uniref:Citrate lyase subunit beta / citryl-CoA lyase n=2 Tax=Ruegeria marina TaxID=639004 RepID=A0A1G6TCJ6_9RHOB|nr:citrate lyase subunit beta / citryl-CoA lyase [Ruegeria marina]